MGPLLLCLSWLTSSVTGKLQLTSDQIQTSSVLPFNSFIVSLETSKQLKVAISGLGGDEIFAGYHKFHQSLKLTQQFPKPIQRAVGSLMSRIDPANVPFTSGFYNFSTRFDKIAETWRLSDPYVAMRQISDFITNRELETVILPWLC